MLLQQDFENAASRDPGRTALVCGAARHSYGELAERARGLASALHARGVKRGDRIALFIDNGVEFVVGMLAALQLGAVFMPVNPLTKHDKLAYMLDDARASALLTSSVLAPVWADALPSTSSVHSVFVQGDCEVSDGRIQAWPSFNAGMTLAALPERGTIDQDLAAIIYTSGSTGFPKGVMLTHLNMVSAARSVSSYLGLRSDDVILCALPLAFDYGLYQVLMAFRLGATVVIERNFSFPVKALERMVVERVTVFPGVPTMFSLLMALKNIGNFDLAALRMITNTAAALSEVHIRQLRCV